MIGKEFIEPKSGEKWTQATLIISVDINGLVPKWIVNLAAKSAPSTWFRDVTVAMQKYRAGGFFIE